MTTPLQRPAGDTGFSLVVVVLLLLAGTVIAHGLMVIAQMEYSVSAASRNVLRARLGARAGVSVLLEAGPPAHRAQAAIGSVADSLGGDLGGVPFSGRMRRLSSELWLAEARGAAGAARVVTARAVWALDPEARVAAVPAVLVTGVSAPIMRSDAVSTETTFAEPTPPPIGGCGPFDRDSLALGSPRVGPVAWAADSLVLVPPFGRLSTEYVGTLLQDTASGRGSPAPADAFGRCDTEAAWNWGDPLRYGRPCSGHLAAVSAPRALFVEGGVGQGLLVLEEGGVLHDLTFFGLIVATGPLELLGRTTVTGFVQARSGISIGPEASINGSACWAWAALGTPLLHSPILLAGSGWIRGYDR